jgi:hypothetical protein
MTRDEWIFEGRMHVTRAERSGWELAWWLVLGREFDPDFSLSQQLTGYSKAHLYNLYRVGVAFPRGRAHPDLSLSAHRELLREPDETERTLLFSRAIEERWTQSDVVAHFEKKAPTPRAQSDHPKAVASRKYYPGAHVRCPCGCGHVFPVKGHKVTDDEARAAREDPNHVRPAPAPEGAVPHRQEETLLAPAGAGGDSAGIDPEVPGARLRPDAPIHPGDA